MGDLTAVFIDPLLRMFHPLQPYYPNATPACSKIQLSSTNEMLSVNIDDVYDHSSRSGNNTSDLKTQWGTSTVLHATGADKISADCTWQIECKA